MLLSVCRVNSIMALGCARALRNADHHQTTAEYLYKPLRQIWSFSSHVSEIKLNLFMNFKDFLAHTPRKRLST